jgi:hypothetical protein
LVIVISTQLLYPIPTSGILRLPNIASEQNSNSLFHVHMFLDTHLTLPIPGTQGDHSRQHICMSMHPRGIGSPWTISAEQGDHSRQHRRMYIHFSGPFQQFKVTIV